MTDGKSSVSKKGDAPSVRGYGDKRGFCNAAF